MPIESIIFANEAEKQLPPDKRTPEHIAWLRALLTPVQSTYEVMEEYIEGSVSASTWNVGTTYGLGDFVSWAGDVWQSTSSGNLGNEPGMTSFWITATVTGGPIGSDERVRYSAFKIVFEYALNRRFGGTFVQPPSVPDIYITTDNIFNQSFIVGFTESQCGIVINSNNTDFIFDDYYLNPGNNFIIHIPVSIFAAIPGGEEEVREFADKINTAGLIYQVETY